jgi:hypothetical protein
MQRHPLLDPGGGDSPFENAAELAGGDSVVALPARKQPTLGHGNASVLSVRAFFPPRPQEIQAPAA